MSTSNECIQMIKCLPASAADRNDPNYIPQLEFTMEAQTIIKQRFHAPIYIIVYAGDMGVGKSKLATVTVNAFHETKPNSSPKMFRSGAGTAGVTQGIWMWSEPLPHPSGNGSIMLLDCEGMGDLNEHIGANLYLFSMIISTSFALLLRPSRIQKSQCDRLYHALFRYERMQYKNMLPNFWLIPELIDYVYSDPNGDDIEITKEQWLEQVFKGVNQENNQISINDACTIQGRYDYINRMLPKKDVAKIDPLPTSLRKDNQNLDMWTILHNRECQQYFQSVQDVIEQLLTTGGKTMMGSRAFIQPAELAHFMAELINLINKDTIPNPDSLVERFLRARFVDDIVKEQKANFERDIISYVQQKLVSSIMQKDRVETPEEKNQVDQEMAEERERLTLKYLSLMVRLARFNIFRYDETLCTEIYSDKKQYQDICQTLPKSIINELDHVEQQMNEYQHPESLIDKARTNMQIADSEKRKRKAEELARYAENARIAAEAHAEQIKRSNEALLSESERIERQIRQARANINSLEKEVRQTEIKLKKTNRDLEKYDASLEAKREEARKAKEEYDRLLKVQEIVKNGSSNQWLVDTDPCPVCPNSRRSIKGGVVHVRGDGCINTLGRDGNWFYYDRSGNEMVCDGCRQITTCDPWRVVCCACCSKKEVTKVY